MPINRHSNTIRCPYCNSKLFVRRFEEHLISFHGLDEGDAKKLFKSAEWKPFIKGKPHGPASVDVSVLSRARAVPPTSEPEPPVSTKPSEKPLNHMDRAELMAELKRVRGED